MWDSAHIVWGSTVSAIATSCLSICHVIKGWYYEVVISTGCFDCYSIRCIFMIVLLSTAMVFVSCPGKDKWWYWLVRLIAPNQVLHCIWACGNFITSGKPHTSCDKQTYHRLLSAMWHPVYSASMKLLPVSNNAHSLGPQTVDRCAHYYSKCISTQKTDVP